MKNNLNTIWKYVVGGGTVLGYQAFYERISSKKNAQDTVNMIKSVNEKIDVLLQKRP